MPTESQPPSLLPVVPEGDGETLALRAVARGVPRPVADLGPAAAFAWDELFSARLRNPHTRAAYRRAVLRFLAWVEGEGVPLPRVTPGLVGAYLDRHPGSVPTRKVALAALRRFFDLLALRHVVVLNPAAAVRGERYSVAEGLTPEIRPDQVRRLLAAIDAGTLLGLRDRAVVGVLVYTAARAGAVARLRRKHLTSDGSQYTLRFEEKGCKVRLVPVRHDLQGFLFDYLDAAGLTAAAPEMPLFRAAPGRRGLPGESGLTGAEIGRVVKRRLARAGLPGHLSPHSFRVATITDLLSQGVPLEDVQFLCGHSDARTTRLYDRRQRRVTRNVVERISL